MTGASLAGFVVATLSFCGLPRCALAGKNTTCNTFIQKRSLISHRASTSSENLGAPDMECGSRLNHWSNNPAACIVIKDAKVLLVKVKYGRSPGWDFPGGKAKNGEPACQTAERETCEETGRAVKAVRKISNWVFECEIIEGGCWNAVDEGFLEQGWFSIDEIDTLGYRGGSWGGNKARVLREQLEGAKLGGAVDLDDCQCQIGREGWSRTRNRCISSSTTDEEEAGWCRDKMTTTGSETTTEEVETTTAQTSPVMTTEEVETTTVQTSPVTATTATTTATTVASTTPTKIKLMSWNVYFGNGKMDSISKMLKQYDVDIANLQETNNRLEQIASKSGYISANKWEQSHDWCGYNFYRSDWSHAYSKEISVPGSRGVCGAMVQKGAAKLCVWGLHPVQRHNNVENARKSIRLAADDMKACSSEFDAPSVFMGDFNTADWRGVQRQLEESTGWGWTLAAKNQIDFIFIQSTPLAVGKVISSEVIGYGCVPGFPGHNTVTSSCGYSDHPAVFAEISFGEALPSQPTSPPETSSPSGDFKTTTGYCRGGPDWSSGLLWDCFDNEATVSQCRERCNAHEECGAFDINVAPDQGSTGQCCLFKAGNTGDGRRGRWCHLKQN
eukprot:TRINITY_DN1867_c0_g1_i7.p1 TRINITY_DN1867_c0_g1~~TRINITY_DN1867_c0_g1_i7.p1  ORF type:complete len:615 (-),score=107.61 TRINITY_DN1867_c0_g1_i7:534-2378(-)